MSEAPDVLVERLRASVSDPRECAALELLIWHEVWINRLAFAPDYGRFLEQEGDVVVIRWKDLERHIWQPEYRYPRDEIHVLRVAVSLAAGTPVYLRDVLSPSVDAGVRRAMVEAFSAAADAGEA